MSIEKKYGNPSGYGVDKEASIEELYGEALLLEGQRDDLLDLCYQAAQDFHSSDDGSMCTDETPCDYCSVINRIEKENKEE